MLKPVDRYQLTEMIENKTKKRLNYPPGVFPEKRYLIETLYNLDSQNSIFRESNGIKVERSIPPEYKLFFNNSFFFIYFIRLYEELKNLPRIHTKNARGFNLTQSQKSEVQKQLFTAVKHKVEHKVSVFKAELINAEKKVERSLRIREYIHYFNIFSINNNS